MPVNLVNSPPLHRLLSGRSPGL